MKTMMRLFLILAAFAGSAAILAAEKPNIIVIYTDDHGWPDIGCAGIYDDLKTPNIDKLAESGVRATNGYSTAPQCVPSRAGLMVGKSQNRFGVESNGAPLDGFNAEQTIAERLKKAGYATGQIGKWHLGPLSKIPTHGFDDFYAKNANRPGLANYTLDGSDAELGRENSKMYHLDACSRAACAFIQRHSNEPFFLYLAYRAPHVPLDAPRKYLSRFPGEMPERRRKALAMISAMDDGVGEILEELRKHDLEENTLIFYIGDNGAPLKIHKYDAPGGGPGWDGSLNKPMNGEKGMLSEGGMRVPFLIRWKGTIPGGQVYHHPVITLDVAATAVELAGLPPDRALDGVDLIPYLTGELEGSPHEFLAWRWVAQSAVREGKWKLLVGGKRQYLYDLEADPEEMNDLLDENPETATRLRRKLETWAGRLDPPGLATRAMSQTWEDYFDFYLEGKPASPLRAKFRTREKKDTAGWIGRNCTVTVEGGSLLVRPGTGNGGPSPFLAQSGFKSDGPVKGTVRIRPEKKGRIGFAWRLKGQKKFPPTQSMTCPVISPGTWASYNIQIPTTEQIIHIRLLLPAGKSEISSIRFEDTEGATVEEWKFEH